MLPDHRSTNQLPVQAKALADSFARAEKCPATIRAYKSDARTFDAWCKSHGLTSMPSTPDTVAAFLAYEARSCRPGPLLRTGSWLVLRWSQQHLLLPISGILKSVHPLT